MTFLALGVLFGTIGQKLVIFLPLPFFRTLPVTFAPPPQPEGAEFHAALFANRQNVVEGVSALSLGVQLLNEDDVAFFPRGTVLPPVTITAYICFPHFHKSRWTNRRPANADTSGAPNQAAHTLYHKRCKMSKRCACFFRKNAAGLPQPESNKQADTKGTA